MKIGVNWHLQFRMIIKELEERLEEKTIKLQIAERKLKKYENNNIGSTGNRKDNNIIKFSRPVHKAGDQT